jgi:hypothetical protein
MSMMKPKIAVGLLFVALTARMLSARSPLAEELSVNPFTNVGLDTLSPPKMPGLTNVLDEPSFPTLRIAELPADHLTAVIDLGPEIEKLRGIVPLSLLSVAQSGPDGSEMPERSEMIDILWFP